MSLLVSYMVSYGENPYSKVAFSFNVPQALTISLAKVLKSGGAPPTFSAALFSKSGGALFMSNFFRGQFVIFVVRNIIFTVFF